MARFIKGELQDLVSGSEQTDRRGNLINSTRVSWPAGLKSALAKIANVANICVKICPLERFLKRKQEKKVLMLQDDNGHCEGSGDGVDG